jgi:hypothetical protein
VKVLALFDWGYYLANINAVFHYRVTWLEIVQ